MSETKDRKLPSKEKVADKVVSATDTEDTQGKDRKRPIRNYISACFIGFIAPALVIWASYAIFPIMYHKDVVAGVHDFSDCVILAYDVEAGKLMATNETIEIAQVDHEIKLVQAKTYEGSIFGLGFIHAKDRLFQLHITRMIA